MPATALLEPLLLTTNRRASLTTKFMVPTPSAPTNNAPCTLKKTMAGAPASRRNLQIATLLFAVLILNAADLICSLFAARLGELTEINPLAETFLHLGLIGSFVSFKILMVVCGCIMLWKLRASRWCAPACWLLIAAYAALAVVWILWLKDLRFCLQTELNLGPVHLPHLPH